MQMSIHSVLRTGMFLYTLCCSFGIYYGLNRREVPEQATIPITLFVAHEMDSHPFNENASSASQLNSTYESEDDDDTARVFFICAVYDTVVRHENSIIYTATYPSIQLDITTPPPKIA